MTTNENKKGPIHRLRRIVAWTGAGVAGVLVIVVVALLIPAVRGALLREAIIRADATLPGTLAVERASWPAPGVIELAGVIWTDDADTLARATVLRLDVRLWALTRRDVDIESVHLTGAAADIPAITARFPSTADTTATGEPSGFPRAGALAGLPSIAVRHLVVAADSIRVGPGDVLSGINVDARADLLHGHRPTAQIDRLSVYGQARAWGIDGMNVEIDLARGVVDGRIHGRARRHWPFFVTLASDGSDRYIVTVTTEENATPPRDIGASIALDVERDGLNVERLKLSADVRTPGVEDLSADPALADALASAPQLDGVVAHIEAAAVISPALFVDGSVVIDENEWLRGARVEAGYRNGVADVAEATIALDGFDLRMQGRADDDSLQALAAVEVSHGGWIETLSPGTSAPPSLEGRVDLAVRGALPLEHVFLEILAGAMGYHAGVSAEVDRGVATTVRVSPVVVRQASVRRAPILDGRAGTVSISPAGAMKATNVRITGDFGNVRIDADIDNEKRGGASVSALWPALPAALATALDLGPARTDSLRTLWNRHGPFSLTARADIGDDIRARGTIDLPGPKTFAPLLPATAQVSDLGNITGSFDARMGAAQDGPIDMLLDLGSTAWIDTAAARLRLLGSRATVDELVLAIDSLHVTATGVASAEQLDLATRVSLTGSEFLRRFVPDIPTLRVAFDAAVTGTQRAPEISADLTATVAGTAIAGTARVGSAGADIRLNAPDGVATAQARFDIAELTVTNHNPGARLLPADVTINFAGEGVALYHAASIDDSNGITIAGDTLGLTVGGRDLSTRRPFLVRVGPQPGHIVAENIDMTGTLGSIYLAANLSADSAVVTADISVRMPEKPSSLELPDNYWPGSATARLRATADGRIVANIDVGGVTLADGQRPDVKAEFESTGEEIVVVIAVTEEDTVLLDARGRLPAAISLTPPSFHTGAGPANVEIHAHHIPVALPIEDDGDSRVVQVSGDARLSGTMEAPAGTLSALVEFPGWQKLDGYQAEFSSTINAGTGEDAVDATLRLSRQGTSLMTASIRYAGALALAPPFVPDDGSGRLDVRARSESIELDNFGALLPPNVAMRGAILLRLDAEGPPRNPSLDGQIDASNVEVTLKQHMRLLSNGRVDLSGDVATPVARGNIVIESGLIQIPEPPKALHPVSGSALLLEQSAASPDTSVAALTPKKTSPLQGDIDIKVAIPGALWIRGQGLEVELAGQLRLTQKDGLPALTGELRAVRGSLILLGRSFQLDRGTVVFYGDYDVNPSLDVQLSTTIDGVTVTVAMTGTAAEPEFMLSSIPEMEEGDIMSYLVFGRRLDNLDQDQKSLVETRATEIAAAMGAARLQDQLREQLGVDMVTIRGANASDESSALVIGKYLNPRLLIKYERLLEEQAAQFINIEYFLTRRLKIDTLYGRSDQQGIEIEWSNEY